MTDPISDMLTRIRNAQAVRKETVIVPYSKLLWAIAELLKREGFIADAVKRGRKVVRAIELTLVYNEQKQPKIRGLRRMSKSSRRMYSGVRALRPVKYSHGCSIISTSKGLVTNRQAKKEGVGGEVMFEIW